MSNQQNKQQPQQAKEQSPVRGTGSFATFLAKARKVESAGSNVRSTAHTSSVFVPADVEANDKAKK